MPAVYVANLPLAATEEYVRRLFSQYGEVAYAVLPAKGYAFIEMASSAAASAAVAALDGSACPAPDQARKLIVTRPGDNGGRNVAQGSAKSPAFQKLELMVGSLEQSSKEFDIANPLDGGRVSPDEPERPDANRSLAAVAIILGVTLAVAFAVYVWPTRYRYEAIPPAAIARIDRFTGDVDVLWINQNSPDAWRRFVSPNSGR